MDRILSFGRAQTTIIICTERTNSWFIKNVKANVHKTMVRLKFSNKRAFGYLTIGLKPK